MYLRDKTEFLGVEFTKKDGSKEFITPSSEIKEQIEAYLNDESGPFPPRVYYPSLVKEMVDFANNYKPKNMYFKPSVEELHISYQCEIMSKYYQGNGNYDEDFQRLLIKDWDDLHLANLAVPYGNIRTKYLDKQDIESLGWKYEDVYRDGGTLIFSIDKEGYKWVLNFSEHKPADPIRVKIFCVSGTVSKEAGSYYGTAKSINELKTLMKLLNITPNGEENATNGSNIPG